MSITVEEAHRRQLEEIAAEYEAQGYHVDVEPSPEKLPPFLAGYRPDIFAQS